jgi:hypothetical protein
MPAGAVHGLLHCGLTLLLWATVRVYRSLIQVTTGCARLHPAALKAVGMGQSSMPRAQGCVLQQGWNKQHHRPGLPNCTH